MSLLPFGLSFVAGVLIFSLVTLGIALYQLRRGHSWRAVVAPALGVQVGLMLMWLWIWVTWVDPWLLYRYGFGIGVIL